MKQVWLRHKNGNGKIYGNDAFATESSFLDRRSSIGDHVEVYDSELICSVVTDSAVISGARIVDSYISDDVRIHGAVKVTNSSLSGSCRLWGDASVSDSALHGVYVFGNAKVEGFSLSASVRLHSGHWTRAPRYQVITGDRIEVVISECTEGRAHIGCWCLSYDDWFRKGFRQRIGARSGWSPEMVEETYRWFKEWAV